MKKGMTYVIAICVTVAVVATCALFPPFLARQGDKSLLNVVKQDTSVSESYEYKATNYQKVKVLYEVCGYSFGYFRHFQMRTDMYGPTDTAAAESSAEKWTEEEIAAYEMEMASYVILSSMPIPPLLKRLNMRSRTPKCPKKRRKKLLYEK